ncbi:MAG: HAMP domain-containing histidine kinase [Acidimicrobiales bacterium]|nr:HAMP domain-containing histidine kinase [Acidimicrobiales bacterium]
MSLRARVALLVGLVVAVTTAVGSIGARVVAERELIGEVDEFLIERAQPLVERLGGDQIIDDRGPRGERPVYLGGPVAEFDSRVQIVLNDGTTIVLTGDDVIPLAEADPYNEARRHYVFEEFDLDGSPYRSINWGLPDGTQVAVARDVSEVRSSLTSIGRQLLALAVGVTGLASVAGWFLAGRTSRPIEELTAAADTVARTQDLAVPIGAGGGGEVGALAASFNTMLAGLRTSREQQHRLVLDAGHELRTPLTSLRASVELLDQPGLDPADRQQLGHRIRTEIDELTTLVNELVDLGTDAQIHEAPEPCDLCDLVDAVAAGARRRHGRSVVVSGLESVPLVGQPTMLRRALANLVANAEKFSPADSEIEILVGTDAEPGGPDHAFVTVRDRGPGFAPADLPHVFDRFYRAAEARSTSGSGLGLSIVRHIAEAHGGIAWAENRIDGAGAAVGIRIPLTPVVSAPIG